MEEFINSCIQKEERKRKPNYEVLDMLYSSAQEVQLFLDMLYQSRSPFADYVIRVVRFEPLYAPLTALPIPPDPDELHRRLLRGTKQQNTTVLLAYNSSKSNSIDTLITLLAYYLNGNPANCSNYSPTEFEVLFNYIGQSLLKCRIMSASS